MKKLGQAATVAATVVLFSIPITSMAAGSQATAGVTKNSGNVYVNSTLYPLSGSKAKISVDVAISEKLAFMLSSSSASPSSADNSISFMDLGVRYRLGENTSTYFSGNRVKAGTNSETLMMLGAMHHISVGESSSLALKLGTSTSNLFDDLETGFDLNIGFMDALILNIGYTSKVTTLAKTSTKATSSSFNVSIGSKF